MRYAVLFAHRDSHSLGDLDIFDIIDAKDDEDAKKKGNEKFLRYFMDYYRWTDLRSVLSEMVVPPTVVRISDPIATITTKDSLTLSVRSTLETELTAQWKAQEEKYAEELRAMRRREYEQLKKEFEND